MTPHRLQILLTLWVYLFILVGEKEEMTKPKLEKVSGLSSSLLLRHKQCWSPGTFLDKKATSRQKVSQYKRECLLLVPCVSLCDVRVCCFLIDDIFKVRSS